MVVVINSKDTVELVSFVTVKDKVDITSYKIEEPCSYFDFSHTLVLEVLDIDALVIKKDK